MKKIVLIIAIIGFHLGFSQVPNTNDLVVIHSATTAEIAAMTNLIEGSLVYNSESNLLFQYIGSGWKKLTPEGNETIVTATDNINISGNGTTIDPYIVSSIKSTFTTNPDGSFTFANGTDPNLNFSPITPGNLPVIITSNAGVGNCDQFILNETKNLIIDGQYFDGGSTVSIAGQTVNSVTVQSSNRLIASITTGNTYGDYDITVTNNSGASTKIGEFMLQVPIPLTTYPITQAEMTLTAGAMTYDGTTLTKTGVNGWNAQGYSLAHVLNPDSGGRLEFTTSQSNLLAMIGLSANPAQNSTYTSLDYAMYLVSNSSIDIREKGASKGYQSPYVAGDVLSISVDCSGKVSYLRNGTVFYTSTILATAPLYFDNSFHRQNFAITNITMTY